MSTTHPTSTEPPEDPELDAPGGAAATAPTAEHTPRTPRRRRSGLLVAFGLLVLAMLLVGLHVREYRLVSPIDEMQHIDYALKIREGELVRQGDRVDEEAMRAVACRGVDAAVVVPSCEARSYRPSQFPEQGFNTAYAHPPGYYFVSGVGGFVLQVLPGIGPVTGVRLMGAAWLGGGLIAMWYALGELRIRPRARVPVLLLVASAPTVLHASATVNPDATSIAIGAVTLLIVLRWEAGRASPWLLAAVAAAAMFTKATNLMGVAAAALYIVFRWVQVRRSEAAAAGPGGPAPDGGGSSPRLATRPVLAVLAMAAVAGALTAGSWAVATEAMARIDQAEIPMAQRFHVDGLTLDQVVDSVPTALSPLRDPYLPAMIAGPFLRVSDSLVDKLLIAGLVAALLMSVAGSRQRALAGATLVCLLALGPFFVVFDFYATHGYFVVPPRYGLALVPFMGAAVAAACERTRLGLAVLWGVAGLSLTTMVAALV